MKIEYKSLKKPTYFVVKLIPSGSELVILSSKSTLESAKRDAKRLAKEEKYPNYMVVKSLGKIGYF